MIKFVQPSATKDNTPRSRGEKRKGVHFDVGTKEDVSSLPIATSNFIHQSGWTWEAISRAFNCDDHPTEHEGLMEEILELCSWGTDEVAYKDPHDDDSDDEEWMAAVRNGFHKHNGNAPTTAFGKGSPKLPTIVASSSAQAKKEITVSSLRLNSLLRLDSHRFGTAKEKAEPKFIPSRSTSCSQDSSSSDSNGFPDVNFFDLEKAFKGIIEDDNSRRCDEPQCVNDNGSKDDFWNKVEF